MLIASSKNGTGEIIAAFEDLTLVEIIFCIIESCLFVPTLFGNVLILVAMRRYSWLHSAVNILIGNLSVCDLCMGICLIPFDMVGTLLGMNRHRWVCFLQISLVVSLMLESLMTMLAISIERYYSVVYPWKHRASNSKHSVIIFIVTSWLSVVSFGFFPFLGIDSFEDTLKCRVLGVLPVIYRYVLNSVVIVVIVVKAIFFALVVRVAINKSGHRRSSVQTESVIIHKRILKTYLLIALSAIFIICWAPYCIVTFFNVFMQSTHLKEVQGWLFLLIFINSSLNWLIFGLKNEKFRKAFKMILCKRKQPPEIERQMSSFTS